VMSWTMALSISAITNSPALTTFFEAREKIFSERVRPAMAREISAKIDKA